VVLIDYKAHGFAASWGSSLAGRGVLSVPFLDVIAAALTVGRPSWSAVLRYGVYSRAELVYRLFQVVANLVPSNGRIVRSPAYDGLDPSEKSAISYHCGLTFAKLVVDEFFAVPFLQHIASYPPPSARYRTNQRPDLAGLDASGRWYVVEAKGRSNESNSALLLQAKTQATCVRTVCGTSPCLRLAVVTDFPRGVLRVQIEDPEGADDPPGDWEISVAQTLQLHYAPFLAIMNNFGHDAIAVRNRQFAAVPLAEVDLTVGLDTRLIRPLQALGLSTESYSPVTDVLGLLPREVEHVRAIDVHPGELWSARIGRDGILIGVGRSWEMYEDA